MNKKKFVIFHLFFVFSLVDAQSHLGTETDVPSQDLVSNFQPSLAVVISILSIMFALTAGLLICARFCHKTRYENEEMMNQHNVLTGISSRFSGIDKSVIASLPFFRFSSLKGSKGGLECAVCLSKFEDIEILRLLPKCKHAFHINCVDLWLEKHSSCPLCRHKVSIEDPTTFTYSNSMRFLSEHTESHQDSNIQLFVQREESNHLNCSSKFSIDPDNEMLIQEEGQISFHKLNHKIVISDPVILKNRWSNVSSSDLIYLNSEMVNEISSNRFDSIDGELKGKTEKRSMSEIIGMSRYGNREICMANNGKEERMRKLWLPIARKTVQWFAHREKRYQHQQLEV